MLDVKVISTEGIDETNKNLTTQPLQKNIVKTAVTVVFPFREVAPSDSYVYN